MSSFCVDQFLQVKCKFQLTSETESSESAHSNNERVRLCTSTELDKNSTLIVMVCSNENGNNHIVAYYVERRLCPALISNTSCQVERSSPPPPPISPDQVRSPSKLAHNPLSFSQLAGVQSIVSPKASGIARAMGKLTRSKPRVIVKQIYYHSYNEDIVALCLSDSGNKLALVSASSTVYILPIQNILLNLHAKQLRSSQGKSMYFYDASILDCCRLENPIAAVYWESQEASEMVVLGNELGELSFISVHEKKEVQKSHLSSNERLSGLKIIKDRFSYSLLISCESFRQYRFALELIKTPPGPINAPDAGPPPGGQVNGSPPNQAHSDEYIFLEKDILGSLDRRPILIKLPCSNLANGHHQAHHSVGVNSAAAVFHRVLAPSSRSAAAAQANLFARERSVPLIFSHQSSNLISVIDVLGAQQRPSSSSSSSNNNTQSQASALGMSSEPRLLRFFSSKQFYYRPQKPTLVCKLTCLDPDELITQLVLTDRFLAIATNRDRCLINSRNCCNLRNSASSLSPTGNSFLAAASSSIELDPLVKEITFTGEERILMLLKSPVSNDQDQIIDSFLLVTSRSIYSIEARQNCRDMFVSLIDAHLGIKSARPAKRAREISSTGSFREFAIVGDYLKQQQQQQQEYQLNELQSGFNPFQQRLESSSSNLLINSFLSQRDEVYERIAYDSRAFSILFKLELNSLYEAYGDRLLIRQQFTLANRFFQMAKFDHTRTLGKYIRLGAYKQTIDYSIDILADENEILDEKERIDLAKAAFDCLLAKTIIERSKQSLYRIRLSRNKLDRLTKHWESISQSHHHLSQNNSANKSPLDSPINLCNSFNTKIGAGLAKVDLYKLCEHSPRGQASKLSANTIIVGGENHADDCDDEATMKANDANRQYSQNKTVRLECEKALIGFVKNYLPSSLHAHVMTQLVDFNLIDLADPIARSDTRFYSLITILLKSKDENRAIFRDSRFEMLARRLTANQHDQLVKIDSSEPKFLEFITSPEATKALIKDIALTSKYLGYQPKLDQLWRYSYVALRQLDSYRKLVQCNADSTDCPNNGHKQKPVIEQQDSDRPLLMSEHKKPIEGIFVEFLNASLDESAEDSYRLWFNYINFYLNYVGTLEELEQDILELFDSNSYDCRLSIALFKAINRSESDRQEDGGDSFIGDALGSENSPLKCMKKLYGLSDLFTNQFLMKLLEKTLELIPELGTTFELV